MYCICTTSICFSKSVWPLLQKYVFDEILPFSLSWNICKTVIWKVVYVEMQQFVRLLCKHLMYFLNCGNSDTRIKNGTQWGVLRLSCIIYREND